MEVPLLENPLAGIAAIAPELIDQGCTAAFRVGDVGAHAAAFLESLADALGEQQEGEEEFDLDASDLRIKSDEEQLRELQVEPPSAEAAAAAATAPLPWRRASAAATAAAAAAGSEGAEDAPSLEDLAAAAASPAPSSGAAGGAAPPSAPHPAAARAAPQHAAFRAAVEAMRRRRAADRAAAEASLFSVRGVPPRTAPIASERRTETLHRVADLISGKAGPPPPAGAPRPAGAPSARPPPPASLDGEVVLTVAVHLPHAPAGEVAEEWLLLGSQPLAALRDAVHCQAEANVRAVEAEEAARRAERGEPPLALWSPAAYVYAEGTFYYDGRAEGAPDASEPVRRRLAGAGARAPPHPPPGGGGGGGGGGAPRARGAPPPAPTTEFSVARMEDTRVEDLWLRLGAGAPGLYCHQGCEHLLVFRDARRWDGAADPPAAPHFPFRLGATRHFRARFCEVCGLHRAGVVTRGDAAAPHSPFFWCAECFAAAHYGADGRLRAPADFTAFPYSQEYQAYAVAGEPTAAARRVVKRRPRQKPQAAGGGGGGDGGE